MKKTLCLILCLMLLAGVTAAQAAPVPTLDTPNEIPLLFGDDIPQTPEGIHHYLLLCADNRDKNARDKGTIEFVDGLVLVTVDTLTRRVMLTSFTREMLVQYLPGQYVPVGSKTADDSVPHFGRINNVVTNTWSVITKKRESLPVSALVDILNSHLGLRIEKYIMVDFLSVENIIDAIGGVDITITNGESIYLKAKDAYKADWTTPALNGAGTYHFRGYAALIYMRTRSNVRVNGESYDIRRTLRVRETLISIAESLQGVNYSKAMEILDVIMDNIFDTNMTNADLLEAVTIAMDLIDENLEIEQFRIPMDGTYDEVLYAGMDVQQIDYVANRNALHDFLFNSYIVVDDDWE